MTKIGMSSVIPVFKPIGKTPLQVIIRLQEKFPQLIGRKLGYAGRLDPMAEGLLLILVGEENKRRKFYEQLPKKYLFSVLFGISTDSYDLLGVISSSYSKSIFFPSRRVKTAISSFRGSFEQTYPPFSSAAVNGRPLFYWAREKKLSEIRIPKKQVTIDDIILTKTTTLSKSELQNVVYQRINSVSGNFRQAEIENTWDAFFQNSSPQTFPLYTFTISCSSGTYVRGLANDLGAKLGVGAVAFEIVRTHIGTYTLRDALRLL